MDGTSGVRSMWEYTCKTSDYAAVIAGLATFGVPKPVDPALPARPTGLARPDGVSAAEAKYWCVLLEAGLTAERVSAREAGVLDDEEFLHALRVHKSDGPRLDLYGGIIGAVVCDKAEEDETGKSAQPGGAIHVANPGTLSGERTSAPVDGQVDHAQ